MPISTTIPEVLVAFLVLIALVAALRDIFVSWLLYRWRRDLKRARREVLERLDQELALAIAEEEEKIG